MLYSLGTIKAVNRNDRFTSIRDGRSNVSNAQKPVIRRRLANGSNRPLLAGPGTEGMR
jgi:hypothetical protein